MIPRESQAYYREKIAYLPNSYQPNDQSRKLSEKNTSREELRPAAVGFRVLLLQ